MMRWSKERNKWVSCCVNKAHSIKSYLNSCRVYMYSCIKSTYTYRLVMCTVVECINSVWGYAVVGNLSPTLISDYSVYNSDFTLVPIQVIMLCPQDALILVITMCKWSAVHMHVYIYKYIYIIIQIHTCSQDVYSLDYSFELLLACDMLRPTTCMCRCWFLISVHCTCLLWFGILFMVCYKNMQVHVAYMTYMYVLASWENN